MPAAVRAVFNSVVIYLTRTTCIATTKVCVPEIAKN